MSIRVFDSPAEDFFADHALSEAAIELHEPHRSMKTRLRPYFPIIFHPDTHIFWVEEDGIVVAASTVMPLTPKTLALEYISVDEGYRDRGIATAIVQRLCAYMKVHGFVNLDSSYYSTETGMLFLKRVQRRIGTQGIQLLEAGKPFHGKPPPKSKRKG